MVGLSLGVLGMQCHCVTLCDPELTFDLAIVTLTYKIFSMLYLRNHEV